MVIKYGSFLNLLKNVAKWDNKVIIDIEKHYRKGNLFKTLSPSKTYSPLIVIDPVQSDRNAAAAISKEKFEKFRAVCKSFIRNPSIEFFTETYLTIESIKKIAGGRRFIIFKVNPLNGKEDIVGCKLLKVYEYLAKKFGESEFKIIKKGWNWNARNDALYYFVFGNTELSEFKKQTGPLISLPEHVKRFKDVHRETFIDGNRIRSYVKRKFTSPEKMAMKLITEDYVKERVRSILIYKDNN